MRTTVAVTLTVLALVLGTPGPGSQSNAAPRAARTPSILVHMLGDRGEAPTNLLGVNHQFDANGRRLWDTRTDAPVQDVVDKAIRAGIQHVRFPGGTVAKLYDWKKAVETPRGCQTVAPSRPGAQGRAVTRRLAFGPDEFMEFVNQIGAKPNIMVPFVNETPADAADWVEYMNAPLGTNPNGGTAWAETRKDNGHPEPYGVHWWEIGNEPHHLNSRHWLSRDDATALRQYAFGGSKVIRGEYLGKRCAHPTAGIASNGSPGQTFSVLYPPVDPNSVRVVEKQTGTVWKRVDDLTLAPPDAQVYTVDAESGRISFGDGVNGAVPQQGSLMRTTYRSVHEGYFEFVRRMKQVDPSIEVCSTWGAKSFNQLLRRRGYDCMAAHAITPLTNPGAPTWSGPLEGHDRTMMKADNLEARVRDLRRTMPPSTPLLLTEFVAMHGDSNAYPAWGTAVTHAVFMSSLWAEWLNMKIRVGNGDDFLGAGHSAVLGRRHTFTADAVTREALKPMFSAGGQLLTTDITANPIRRPRSASGSYPGLTVAATRASGVLRLLVVNRLPRESVTTRIRLDRGRAKGTADIRSVTGKSFTSWNQPDVPPDVVLNTSTKRIAATGFSYTFPAASTTVFTIPWAMR